MLRKKLSNTRARFQRLRDAKIFSGWVRTFSENNVVVVTPKDMEYETGDTFVFQVYGPGNIAVFRAVMEYCSGNVLSLRLASTVHFATQTEDMRLLLEGTTGVLMSEGCNFDVMLVDVSARGAAVLSSGQLDKGAPIELHIDSNLGQVVVKGEVKYCRKAEGMQDQYRIGMSLKPDNRIDSARWQQILAAEAA